MSEFSMDNFSIYQGSKLAALGYEKKRGTWRPPPLIKNKFARNILAVLGYGVLGALITMHPAGIVYFMVHGAVVLSMKKQDYQREIKRLQKRGYIALTKSPDGSAARLLKKGKTRLQEVFLEELRLPRHPRWDGKWHLFIFDIPEESRLARNMLRRKLKDLGMYNMQRSAFVYPYDCRKELEFISNHYGINKFAAYMEISDSDIDAELRRFFHLKRV